MIKLLKIHTLNRLEVYIIILVGLIAFIKPFEFPIKIIYIAGIFMFAAAFMLYYLMRSGKILSKREGYLLILFWLIFVLMEVTIHF